MKTWRQARLALAGVGTLLLGHTAAAAPLDGEWTGESDNGTCVGGFAIQIKIADGKIGGTARLYSNRKNESPWDALGEIDADNAVTLRLEATDMRIPPQNRLVVFRGKAEQGVIALAQDSSKSCGRKVALKKK